MNKTSQRIGKFITDQEQLFQYIYYNYARTVYIHNLFCLFFLYLGCSTCLLRSTRSIMTYCYGVLRPPLVFEIALIQWLSSFLRGRTQQVIFNNPESTIAKVTSRVPQGSVLGTLLFLLYTADISVFAMEHSLGVDCYANN